MFDPKEIAERKVYEMPAPLRSPRPIADLARLFGQFALLQHRFGENVNALEQSVGQQRAELEADLPMMKKKITWLTRQGRTPRKR